MHESMMARALELAETALKVGEVPVGAVIYKKSGEIVGEGYNFVISSNDPTAHAEIVALRKAAQYQKSARLDGLMMAVTLEPCAMCAQAISHAKIAELRFGAYDVKSGGVQNGARIYDHKTCHHKPDVYGGLMEEPCSKILQSFFREKR
jgi:tRNA(adenine34) deaminase